MQHKEGSFSRAGKTHNATALKDLFILQRIAHKNSITAASSEGISSQLARFDLKGSKELLIMPLLVPPALLHYLFQLLFLHHLQTHLLLKWYNKWFFLHLGSQVILIFLLNLGTLILELLTIWAILQCLFPMYKIKMEIRKFTQLMATLCLLVLLVIFPLPWLMFLCLPVFPQILFLLANWLIMIIMSNFLVLVVLCRIKCLGR